MTGVAKEAAWCSRFVNFEGLEESCESRVGGVRIKMTGLAKGEEELNGVQGAETSKSSRTASRRVSNFRRIEIQMTERRNGMKGRPTAPPSTSVAGGFQELSYKLDKIPKFKEQEIRNRHRHQNFVNFLF
ncbi:unnamed protein product [Caenorhabditis nigoni]